MARLERNACTTKVAHALMRRNFEIDVRELLPTLQVPTRVVHVTGDPAVHIELGRYLAEHIEGATLVEIPGDFHATWGADLNQWLRRSPNSSPAPGPNGRPSVCSRRSCSPISSTRRTLRLQAADVHAQNAFGIDLCRAQ